MSQVTWQSPPERPTQYDWPAIATQLRRKPGKWALIFDRDRSSVVNAIRQGSIPVLDPALGFEVRTTNTQRDDEGKRVCSLYLRFNSEKGGS